MCTIVYLPASQLVQTEASATEYLPAVQSVQTEAAATENVPALQLVQTEARDAPVAVEYLPAAQSWQVLPPVVVRYLPAAQSRHAALPALALYLPAPHAVHVPPSCPEKPATHTQSVAASLPVVDCELEGQFWQVLAVVAPVVAEYVPAPQSAQAFVIVVLSVSTPARNELPACTTILM